MIFEQLRFKIQAMKKPSITIFLIIVSFSLFSQTTIKMKRQGGVSIIPCIVNGLSLELIFDTGASDVSISLSEASLMLENGKLTNSDIIGTANYLNANGDIIEGIVVNIKEIEIAGLKMTNIKASVVKNLDAPLLLGQTAISKLGNIQLDLNNNTLTILNGKGTYDYSTYSLNDKIEKHYKDFSIVKIEKRDNKEGVYFSYTIPKKWKEEKVTNTVLFKNYISDEYPYGLIYGLNIGLQTLPALFNSYDSMQKYVENINNLIKNIEPTFKLISTSNTKVSFCKTIKNIILTKDDYINKLSFQYWIFFGNKCLSFIYSVYSTDIIKINTITSEFDDYCTSQVSRIIVFNAIENAATCTIESNAIENKKNVSIILNNACKWYKSENQNQNLNLINRNTSSILAISINDESPDLSDYIDTNDLNAFKKVFSESIKSTQELESSDIVTIGKKKYIYIKSRSENAKKFVLTDFYYYYFNKRFILILSLILDGNKDSLESRYRQSHSDVIELLNGIEYKGKSTQNANDYFNKGLTKVQNNDYKGGIKDFNQAIELNPKFFEAYFNRGTAKVRINDNIGAIDDFTKAISIKPDFDQAYYNRGIAKFQIQDYQGATEDFNKEIEINPAFADAYLNRGLIKIVLGKKEGGCIDLKKAKELGAVKADNAIKLYCK